MIKSVSMGLIGAALTLGAGPALAFSTNTGVQIINQSPDQIRISALGHNASIPPSGQVYFGVGSTVWFFKTTPYVYPVNVLKQRVVQGRRQLIPACQVMIHVRNQYVAGPRVTGCGVTSSSAQCQAVSFVGPTACSVRVNVN